MEIDTDTKNVFDQSSRAPHASELFAGQAHPDISAEDLFAGDDKLYRMIEKGRGPDLLSQAGKAAHKAGVKLLTPTHIVLLINVIVIMGVTGYLAMRDPDGAANPSTQQTPVSGAATELPRIPLSRTTAAALDHAVSWQVAEQFLLSGDYTRAYYVYEKLNRNLTQHKEDDELIRDMLYLKMALCLQNLPQYGSPDPLFDRALISRSPAVRMLANYHLMMTAMANRNYEIARIRAYKTLALLPTVQEECSANFEGDCYFTMAEALTRQVLLLNNQDIVLPGVLWSESLSLEHLPVATQEQLRALLQRGVEQTGPAALAPYIAKQPGLSVGSQWSAIALEAPLSEFLARFAAESGWNLSWTAFQEDAKKRPVTLYLPGDAEQRIPEIAAGSVGWIAEFNTDDIVIHNPDIYENLADHTHLLAREAIYVWRRFLLRYRGDHRTPNAHYALGLMHETIDQSVAAMGEYKLVSGQFPHNPLAPHALFNASRIKTEMRDYEGAKADLTEILVQYSDSQLVDEASLYLAEATVKAGLYDDAAHMFRKVYNLDLSKESRCRAAYGAGRCAFELKQFEEAKKWLMQGLLMTDHPQDRRRGPGYFLLGKTLMQLQDFPQAALALRQALETSLSPDDYIEVVLQLVQAERGQGNYVAALNMLETVPQEKLTQYYLCQFLTAQAQLFRDIGLTDIAITLLRRQIQFIADARNRALLTLELAKCELQIDDAKQARQDLVEALKHLSAVEQIHEAHLLLADVCYRLGDLTQTEDICLRFLRRKEVPASQRNTAFEILGRVYTTKNEHGRAALAYAGLLETGTGGTN
ncbi:MAG: hypothetical protein JW828_09680 [Sedimentisphaerales bacterium]|nr:hypothetical protein [Sedimentisphaerales bacterium]